MGNLIKRYSAKNSCIVLFVATSMKSRGLQCIQFENHHYNSSVWPASFVQEKQLFSELNKLESELVDTLNDHIRLVQFGYDGDVEKINLLLRLAFLMAHQRTYLCTSSFKEMGSNYCFDLYEWLTALVT